MATETNQMNLLTHLSLVNSPNNFGSEFIYNELRPQNLQTFLWRSLQFSFTQVPPLS